MLDPIKNLYKENSDIISVSKKVFPIWIIAILLCYLVWSYIPDWFNDITKEKIVLEMKNAYENEVIAEYDSLMSKYTEEFAEYQEDYSKYLFDLLDFEKTLEQYEKDYAAEVEQYNADLQALEIAQDNYDKAYQAAYNKAESAAYANGVEFRIYAYANRNWNNHVGNDWRYRHLVNGTVYYDASPIKLYSGSGVSCSSTIQEADKIPDTSYGSGYHTVSYNDLKDGFTVAFQVIVTENRGRYSGNTAGFTVEYTFDPIEPTFTVDTSNLPEVPEDPVEPKYSPPKNTLVEPTKPVEPTMEDVTVIEPDYEDIEISRQDVFAYNKAPVYIWIATIFISCFISVSYSTFTLYLHKKNKNDTNNNL